MRNARLDMCVEITLEMLRNGEIAPESLFSAALFSPAEISGALGEADDVLRTRIRRAFPPASTRTLSGALFRTRIEELRLGVTTDPRGIRDPALRLANHVVDGQKHYSLCRNRAYKTQGVVEG